LIFAQEVFDFFTIVCFAIFCGGGLFIGDPARTIKKAIIIRIDVFMSLDNY